MYTDLLPACVTCNVVIDSEACSFLTCGEMMCQSCCQETCPRNDGGKTLRTSIELHQTLVTIVRNIRESATKCYQKEALLYDLREELGEAYKRDNGGNAEMWVCPNCRVTLNCSYCIVCNAQAPGYNTCRKCQAPIDPAIAICTKCVQETAVPVPAIRKCALCLSLLPPNVSQCPYSQVKSAPIRIEDMVQIKMQVRVCQKCNFPTTPENAICGNCQSPLILGCPVCNAQCPVEDILKDHLENEHLKDLIALRFREVASNLRVTNFHPVLRQPDQLQLSVVENDSLDNELSELFLSNRDSVEQKHIEVDPILQDLELRIRAIYPDSTIAKYGSGANGFTMSKRDFDVTLLLDYRREAFPYQENYKALRGIEKEIKKANPHYTKARKDASLKRAAHKLIFSRIASIFDSQGFQLIDRTSARTPVIKCRRDELELDISIGNEVAVHNTALLNTYCNVDERVRALGLAIKHWAKCRSIADASKGYLSSYSYLILMIGFLQRCSSPLLRSLQEDYPFSQDRIRVGKWDCSFERNPESYRKMALNNTVPLRTLLIEFFQYYGFRFDWGNNCVTIRQTMTVFPKSAKFIELPNWNFAHLAIEDPFEVERNLGDVRTKQVVRLRENAERIQSEFKKAYASLSRGQSFEVMCKSAID